VILTLGSPITSTRLFGCFSLGMLVLALD
jgi:hypothetical protein